MKIHEILYIISIFLIILSAGIYMLSTTVVTGPNEDSVANILGKNSALDSTLSSDDAALEFFELERERNTLFLWIGIPAGIIIFLIALLIKRLKYGPDIFIDREDEDYFL